MSATPKRSSERVPEAIQTLADRYEHHVVDARRRVTRVRLALSGGSSWDAVITDGELTLAPPDGEPDAVLTANAQTWRRVAADIRHGMEAYNAGRLTMRRNLHDGVGFLAATSSDVGPERLRFRRVATRAGELSVMEAGEGPPVLAVHGLGATKGSFLPTLAALADDYRMVTVDLPGFGDSDKPLKASYDAAFFAETLTDLLDGLGVDSVHYVGNSLGGRIGLEIGLRHPERVRSIGLLAPSLAWRRGRPLLPLVQIARPELGLLQLAPRTVVEGLMRRLIPDARDGWAAIGVDEFLRAYLTPSGRAAFYAAARQIYLDEPYGNEGFWTRLPSLQADVLCIWGKQDKLVPIAFARHVSNALPHSQHLELDCGHVPQVERPDQTHAALDQLFARNPARQGRITASRRTRTPPPVAAA